MPVIASCARCAVLTTLFTFGIAVPAVADIAGVSGRFVAIAARAASDVATTLAAREADPSRELIGKAMEVGATISWVREGCVGRPEASGASPAKVDPTLADLQAVVGTDRRINQAWVIDCMGRPASDIWSVLVVDDRVMAARSGPSVTWLVFEKPLTNAEGQRLEEGLRRAGFDPGTIDGTIDGSTRTAIAAFVRQKSGVGGSGVVTRSVFDALVQQ